MDEPNAPTGEQVLAAENVENDVALLWELAGNPLRLLREGGRSGLKNVGRLIAVLLLFGFVNLGLSVYAAYRLFWIDYLHQNIAWFLLILLSATLWSAYAAYRAYCNVLLDVAGIVYRRSSPFIALVCRRLVEHASEFLAAGHGKERHIGKIIHLQQLISEQFGRTPRFIRSALMFVFRRIPVLGMLIDLQDTISGGEKERAIALLHEKVDLYVEESIFSRNTFFWIYWLLPVDILTIILLVG